MAVFDHPNGTLHAALRDRPDGTLIGWDDDFTDDPDTTYAPSPDGLRALAAKLNASCQWQIDPAYIEDQIRHEQEHAAAAVAAGFTKIRYGLFVRRASREILGGVEASTDWHMCACHAAPARPVTKLAYASIVAAPVRLSEGDAQALRDMGYGDAADVARRMEGDRS